MLNLLSKLPNSSSSFRSTDWDSLLSLPTGGFISCSMAAASFSNTGCFHPTPSSPAAAFGNGFAAWNVHFRLLLQQDTRVGNGHGFQVSRDVRLGRSPYCPSPGAINTFAYVEIFTANDHRHVCIRLSVFVCLRLVCTHPERQCTAAHAHPYTQRHHTFLVEITILRNLQLKSCHP